MQKEGEVRIENVVLKKVGGTHYLGIPIEWIKTGILSQNQKYDIIIIKK